MNKTVKPLLNTRMRPIEPKDFAIIRSLAAEFPAFTVPSEYVLWFFSHFHPEFCRVLEHKSGEVKAYMLAMPTTHPKNGIAIWQIAAAQPNHAFALEYFAAYLRELVEGSGVTSVFFTTAEDSISLRLIRSLAKQFGNCEVVRKNAVPVGQGEHEYLLLLSK